MFLMSQRKPIPEILSTMKNRKKLSVNTISGDKSMSQKQNPEIFELLKVWYFLKSGQYHWPEAVEALESKLNELLELERENWKAEPISPVHQ
jgi:hypothetical protein